jgi:mevalonate pyrophosphate decarboxylase
MALIDPDNPIVHESAEQTRADYLTNLKINQNAVQKAIYELTKAGIKSYTMDTGQNVVTVTRNDLGALRETLKTLNDLIAEAEADAGNGVAGQLVQVVPW